MKQYLQRNAFFIIWILASVFVLFDMKYNFFGSESEVFYETYFDFILSKIAVILWACLSIFVIFKLIKK